MKCDCFWTDPSTWFYYGGVAEPASQIEWNPLCPVHGESPLFDQIAHEMDMTAYDNVGLLFHGHSRRLEGWPLP